MSPSELPPSPKTPTDLLSAGSYVSKWSNLPISPEQVERAQLRQQCECPEPNRDSDSDHGSADEFTQGAGDYLYFYNYKAINDVLARERAKLNAIREKKLDESNTQESQSVKD